MKVSFFETGHYRPPAPLPAVWPVPPAAYDQGAGVQSYRGMVERVRYVEALGFDWVSVAEHHYSLQRLTPAPIVVAAHLVACAKNIKIAVLGPIVSRGEYQIRRFHTPSVEPCRSISVPRTAGIRAPR